MQGATDNLRRIAANINAVCLYFAEKEPNFYDHTNFIDKFLITSEKIWKKLENELEFLNSNGIKVFHYKTNLHGFEVRDLEVRNYLRNHFYPS